ncbi:MAG: hypothetical protein HFG31_06790 [Eubacterium sp.]|nr:hypothetical protein [Eubacterium sp.]
MEGSADERSQTLIEENNEQQVNSVMSGYHGEKYICTQNLDSGNSVNIIKNSNDTELFRSNITNISDKQIVYNIVGKVNKNIVYRLNGAGNITDEFVNGSKAKNYSYDGHGRLIEEKEFNKMIGKRYIYNSTGNISAEWTYTLTDDGKIPSSGGTVKYFTYSSGSWKDLLIRYAGETVSYDESGNPELYRDDYSFTWDRGRQLKQIYKNDSLITTYKYNENGLRTYKKLDNEEHNYEWEKTHLIRETVTYTNQTYDIWYLYDGNGNMVGFEYSYIDELDELQKEQIYFEKNYQGDVIAPFNGIHTVAVRALSNGKFTIYNYYMKSNDTKSISAIKELYTGGGKRYSCIYGFE